ncbi:hypothetical protein [Streptomyces sp. NPDC059278]|uniref:hypothetical protein n=1 Tax=Streptomyces sp. NPDC059278 TaxID=3346801 RepID=UPI003685F281
MEAATTIMGILVHNAVAHADPGPSSDRRRLTLRYAMTDKHDLLIDVYDPLATFPGFERAIEGEEGRGLWTVRQMGGELSWAPCDGGKVVRALLRPGPVPV